MQLFPEKVIRLWSGWEIRLMVLLSFVLQIILIIFGARRKIIARIWIRILVWSVYMSADWVATVALGNLVTSQFGDSDQNNNTLQAFWAPFMLLHLGGPDTTTAYALEDNEFWLRHLLGLVVQVGVAFYVFLLSWSNSAITFINIPVFISGIIKYCERNFVLRSSSVKQFTDSLLSSSDPWQEFVGVEQDKRGQSSEGLEGPSEGLPERSKRFMAVVQGDIAPKDHYLVQAYFCFTKFKYLFANQLVNDKEWKCIYSTIKDKGAADAFKMVAVELGFMYDVFYTKAAIVYSQLGIFIRCISFSCSLSALVVFSITIDIHAYSLIDISITYLLLVGAVFLDIYAFLLLLSSDWINLWLIKLKKATSKALVGHFWRLISDSAPLLSSRKRWSGSIGQYNLISSCLRKVQPTSIGVHELPFVSELLDKHWHFRGKEVNINNLQEKIFKFLKHYGDRLNDQRDHLVSKVLPELILTQRGNFMIKTWYAEDTSMSMWTVDMEFIDSLVIWHIATDLLYYEDLHAKSGGDVNKLDPECKVSKYLSDYMLYLLVFCPFMLPPADILNESRACKGLLEKYPQSTTAESFVEEISTEGNVSLLMYGCILSRKLRELTDRHDNRKWEIISDVWVEMLAYAAENCGWKEHTQQLRKGGEFLTHVYLLMAHFGFTRQYTARKLIQLTAVIDTEDLLEDYLRQEREINREKNKEHV
ncbi:hypothetical protein ACOSQ2_020325 [Xanthoceras sorbifolium]